MVNRKTTRLRNGDILDVEEYHDGQYGAPGKKRKKKEKQTKEQMQIVNKQNKIRRARQKMLEYIREDDLFVTLTYQVKNRPPNMDQARKDFQKAFRKIRKEYKKQERECFWFRNIQQGTKGAWHIHLVINDIGNTASILQDAWELGGVYVTAIKNNDKIYDEDFSKLASYMTRDESTVEFKENGEPEKPRIRQASYNTSRNMPIPEPKEEKLIRWKREVKPKQGYYIARIYEGINPVTGYKYRRYTMIRQERREKYGSENLYRTKYKRGKKLPQRVRLRP